MDACIREPCLAFVASRLGNLDQRLEQWFLDYGKDSRNHIKQRSTTFDLSPGPPTRHLPIRPLSPVFRSELAFQSHHAANVHAIYWQCLAVLRATMHKVQSLSCAPPDDERNLELEACACANLLCRAIPYLLTSASGNVSQASAVRLLIHVTKEFFASSPEYKSELDWCTAAESQLQGHFFTLNWETLLPFSLVAISWQPFEAP